MESMKAYLFSVICASVACAIVGSITAGKGTNGALMKLICGIFLVFTMLSPVTSLKMDALSIFTSDLRENAASAAAVGRSITEESMDAIIKSETEAYILDKAAILDAQLTAEVTLDAQHKPASVTLCGTVSPYVRYRMESILEEDLGIKKENQQWIE